MKVVSLNGTLRENVGKKYARKLRKLNLVPCVLYGGTELVHFALEEKYFQKLVNTPEVCYVEIKINDKNYLTKLQDVQFHPVTDKVIHADFLELTGKQIKMDIPLRIKGNSPGIMRGGKLVINKRKVPIKAKPEDMPEFLDLDISNLDIGDLIKVKDIKSDSFKILLEPETFLVKIAKTRKVDETTAQSST